MRSEFASKSWHINAPISSLVACLWLHSQSPQASGYSKFKPCPKNFQSTWKRLFFCFQVDWF